VRNLFSFFVLGFDEKNSDDRKGEVYKEESANEDD